LLYVIQQFSGMTILRAYVVKIFNTVFAHSTVINGKNFTNLLVNFPLSGGEM